MSRLRIGVLVSGGGSNLQAILDPRQRSVVRLSRERRHQQRRGRARACTRANFESAVHAHLLAARVELIALAGFMRVLTPWFIERWPRKIVNVHPALCPAFPGMHAARQALEHGVKITGCTVHFVDAGVDTGPILAQAAVAVLEGDDESTLQARIQREEHRLLPDVLARLARGAQES